VVFPAACPEACREVYRVLVVYLAAYRVLVVYLAQVVCPEPVVYLARVVCPELVVCLARVAYLLEAYRQ
jgi:hypothetical protein